jgi:hypothetical protein
MPADPFHQFDAMTLERAARKLCMIRGVDPSAFVADRIPGRPVQVVHQQWQRAANEIREMMQVMEAIYDALPEMEEDE